MAVMVMGFLMWGPLWKGFSAQAPVWARAGLWKRPAGRFPKQASDLVESCQAGDTRHAAVETAAGIMKILNSPDGIWSRFAGLQAMVEI
jgi:hypothetical protein